MSRIYDGTNIKGINLPEDEVADQRSILELNSGLLSVPLHPPLNYYSGADFKIYCSGCGAAALWSLLQVSGESR